MLFRSSRSVTFAVAALFVILGGQAAASAANDPASLPGLTSKFVDVKGVKTRYYEMGQGEPMVLVHGGATAGSSTANVWSRNIPGLAKHYHIYAVDRLGSGVDEGTMVDTWSTVGSCAQIGKNCHLSGGVGIGGVLEPLQANPTIIEDNCFIGARSEIVEGVIVEENSVVSMGVYIGQSTKIYDRATREVTYGRIPAGSVVVSGNLPSADGTHSLYCAVIVKRVDAQTRAKTSINDLLRS